MTALQSRQTSSLVRRQYEDFPYPQRDPADEAERFLFTNIDDLATLNHYCFQGKRNLKQGFRALVAGGGTGDSTIHLAEQLKGTDSVIVHLDLSQPSIDVAAQRAAVRGLENVVWIRGSLLDLPDSGLESFDYINCSGVLHHLDDPALGLRALRAVLKDGGAMGLMLYARYGRMAVYQLQELLRMMTKADSDPLNRIRTARNLMDALPETNWSRRSQELFGPQQSYGDSELYDLLLHSTDQPFRISEVHSLLAGAGLNWVEFLPEARALYNPALAFRDPHILESIRVLPLAMQHHAAELFWGSIKKHDFWASTETGTIADFDESENVPFFSRLAWIKNIPASLRGKTEGEWSMSVEGPGGVNLRLAFEIGPVSQRFFRLIDDRRTLGEIVQTIADDFRCGETVTEIRGICREIFDVLTKHDLLLLRHVSTSSPA